MPTMVTPCGWVTWPGSVSSQLPPRSAARSTITEPGFIAETISAVTSTGALLPGTLAVVITTSLSATVLPISSRCLRRKSSPWALA